MLKSTATSAFRIVSAAGAVFLCLIATAQGIYAQTGRTGATGQASPTSPALSPTAGEMLLQICTRWWYLLVILAIVAYLSRRQGEAGHQRRVQERVLNALKDHEESQQSRTRRGR